MIQSQIDASAIPVAPKPCFVGSEPQRWFVVEAFEHSVAQARLNLAVAGLHVWAPVDVKRQPNRSRSGAPRRDLRIPRFGRYLFVRCKLTDALRNAIDNTPAVAGLLVAAKGEAPTPIPDHVIAWLREPPQAEETPFGYVVGDTVRIIDGPFATFEAKVEDVDKRGALRLSVEILGRSTPLVLEVGHVEMALPAKSRAIVGVSKPSSRNRGYTGPAKHAKI